MKAITIILVKVAIAYAKHIENVPQQRMTASLILQTGDNAAKGSVNFTQENIAAPVHVIGNITNLPDGKYFGFVRKATNITNDCNALGSIDMKDNDRLFLVFTVDIMPRDQTFKTASIRFTLFPEQPDSILNRSIALHKDTDMKLAVKGNILARACGVVLP